MEGLEREGDELVIRLRGPDEIEYAVKISPARETTISTPAKATTTSPEVKAIIEVEPIEGKAATQTAATKPIAETAAKRGKAATAASYYWVILAVAVILAVVLAIAVSRRRPVPPGSYRRNRLEPRFP